MPDSRDGQKGESIDQLRQQIGELREEASRSESDRARIERERARLEQENSRLKDELETAHAAAVRQAAPVKPGSGPILPAGFVPPGHYYSPLPDFDQVRADEDRIFTTWPRTIPGIDLREPEQLALLKQLAEYYKDMPFQEHRTGNLRYHFFNHSYAHSDGVFLHCMLRHLKPKRVVEVGSGFSSCVTLDTDELFLDSRTDITFVEPYPQLLQSLIKEDDKGRVTILPQPLQRVDRSVFERLEADDILFIDSTHVSKVDSDVNRLFFEILPVLNRGVYVHVHDVFYPFEYPKESFRAGRAWNELYLLRAFQQFNSAYSIVLMNTFLQHFHEDFFRVHMPLCLVNRGGSIWLRRN